MTTFSSRKPFRGVRFDTSRDYPDSPFTPEELAEVRETQEKGGMVCSFCGKPTTIHEATFGNGKMRKHVELEIYPGPPIEWGEVTKYSSPKQVACEDCCLKVGKTRFAETEG